MLNGVFLMMMPLTLSATEENALQQWLEQPILPADGFPNQIGEFIRGRIPRLEVPATAEEWTEKSAELRRRIRDEIVFRGVPTEWCDPEPEVVWGEVMETGHGYVIQKLRYEALPGLWIPALLYEPEQIEGQVPAVLNVNGHVGPPGKAIEYEQLRCINLAKRGLLALHPEWLFFGELQGDDYKHNRLAYLDLCGVSGLSVFFLAMQRGLDVLENYPRTDPQRIAMTGLSGGGWQTIVLSSLDLRIAIATPNAGYIGVDYRTQFREDIGDLEQVPADLLTIADYPHLTAMLAPRPTLLIYNQEDDCCFKSYRAYPSVYEPVIPFFELFGKAEDFQYYENKDPGTHNYEQDNREQFYRFLNRCFLPESEWVDAEIPSQDEVLEYDDLVVGIPEDNANFFTLARTFLPDLPRFPPPERDAPGFARWQEEGRKRLREVLRLPRLSVRDAAGHAVSKGKLKATRYQLNMDEGWCVPALAVSSSENPEGPVAVVFADAGKKALEARVRELLPSHSVVVAVDPLYTGESVSPSCPVSQCAMMVSTVGERPLGIQTAQMGAVLRWAGEEFSVGAVSLEGVGPTAGIVALSACALNPERVTQVSLRDSLSSLKSLILDHQDYETCPPLFCFGLLEQFDVPELIQLCSPVPVE